MPTSRHREEDQRVTTSEDLHIVRDIEDRRSAEVERFTRSTNRGGKNQRIRGEFSRWGRWDLQKHPDQEDNQFKQKQDKRQKDREVGGSEKK
jgi:hypothetical protein